MQGIKLVRRFFLLLSAIPAIYLLLAVQYGAITVPFADHAPFVEQLASWYDGNFQLHSLWAPDNQSRPLVYRVVLGLNAILTDWNIRSEYVYIYLAFYGTFACHAWGLHQITESGRRNNLVFPAALILASLIVFSPAGHNDQWWSLMFILDAANLFIALSFLLAYLSPRSVVAHIGAAIACWLASYTAANGIFAMLTSSVVFYIASEQFPRPSRWALFWWANLAILLACYFPGIELSGAAAPSALQLLEFSLAFLGAPFGGLLWFPYQNMFDLPLPIMTNALCGAFLIVSSGLMCWDARSRLREQRSAALIVLGFTIFAIISAVATGWGRANNDHYTVSNGNASRYTIFGAYLLLGQLYYIADTLTHRHDNKSLHRLAASGAVIFSVLASLSYDRAIGIYRNVHSFNKQLINAYSWGLQTTPYDRFIYPDPPFMEFKSDLQRLELGPYNDRQYDSQALPAAGFKQIVMLSKATDISQAFTASRDGLKDVSVTMVKPNGRRTRGIIQWKVTEADSSQILASGALNAARIQGWQTIRLKLPYLGDSHGREYRVTLSGNAAATHELGVPLYALEPGENSNVSISGTNGSAKTQKLTMSLVLDYAD